MLRAVVILWRVVEENPSHELTIARSGHVEPLVRLLTMAPSTPGQPPSGDDASVRAYALWKLSLSIDATNQKVVADTGGIEPLVSLLSAVDKRHRTQAARAISKLAYNNGETQRSIVQQGATEPLIALLKVRPNLTLTLTLILTLAPTRTLTLIRTLTLTLTLTLT